MSAANRDSRVMQIPRCWKPTSLSMGYQYDSSRSRVSAIRSNRFAVRRDHVAIPVEAALPDSSQIALIELVTVHVHEPVPLLVAVEPAQEIGARPHTIAEQVD